MSLFLTVAACVLGGFALLYVAACVAGDALAWLADRLYPEDADDEW